MCLERAPFNDVNTNGSGNGNVCDVALSPRCTCNDGKHAKNTVYMGASYNLASFNII